MLQEGMLEKGVLQGGNDRRGRVIRQLVRGEYDSVGRVCM